MSNLDRPIKVFWLDGTFAEKPFHSQSGIFIEYIANESTLIERAGIEMCDVYLITNLELAKVKKLVAKLIEQLRKYKDQAIVLVSLSPVELLARDKVLKLGAHAVVKSPFDLDDLLDAVDVSDNCFSVLKNRVVN